MNERAVVLPLDVRSHAAQERVQESRTLPPELTALLERCAPEEREEAWAAFVQSHSKLIFHAAHTFARGHDATMDAYTFILERLRSEDYRRLRGFVADGRSRFSTWLVVVCRRLCLDHHRHRYGRTRGSLEPDRDLEVRGARRRLTDLVGDRLGVDQLSDEAGPDPERELRQNDLSLALSNAIQRLDPEGQLLLRLRFDDGLTAKEIASLMKLPTPFHVYRRLERLLVDLRKSLAEMGIDNPAP